MVKTTATSDVKIVRDLTNRETFTQGEASQSQPSVSPIIGDGGLRRSNSGSRFFLAQKVGTSGFADVTNLNTSKTLNQQSLDSGVQNGEKQLTESSNFPDQVLGLIFEKLKHVDLIKASSVSRDWRTEAVHQQKLRAGLQFIFEGKADNASKIFDALFNKKNIELDSFKDNMKPEVLLALKTFNSLQHDSHKRSEVLAVCMMLIHSLSTSGADLAIQDGSESIFKRFIQINDEIKDWTVKEKLTVLVPTVFPAVVLPSTEQIGKHYAFMFSLADRLSEAVDKVKFPDAKKSADEIFQALFECLPLMGDTPHFFRGLLEASGNPKWSIATSNLVIKKLFETIPKLSDKIGRMCMAQAAIWIWRQKWVDEVADLLVAAVEVMPTLNRAELSDADEYVITYIEHTLSRIKSEFPDKYGIALKGYRSKIDMPNLGV